MGLNIFFLDRDPKKAAEAQIDKHVIKMILESAQMLCTAHHELYSFHTDLYKPTHKNHPCSIWVRESRDHYNWLYKHMMALGSEYTKRYGKNHKTIMKLGQFLKTPPYLLADKGWADPPQCMPDEFKKGDTVEAYKAYYEYKKKLLEK